MSERALDSKVTVTTFRDQSMDMRIPFQIPAEGMQDTNKSGSKALGYGGFIKHVKNNISYGRKQQV